MTNFRSRHVLFFFMSIRPAGMRKPAAKRRVADYSQSIKQISRLLYLRDWTVVFCDNTIPQNDLDYFVRSNGARGKALILSVGQNLGLKNKGLGELDMLVRGVREYRDLLGTSETVSYFTGRHLMTNLYLIEKTEKLIARALISNPDFLGLDGEIGLASEQTGLINDMFFSMKTAEMLGYASYFEDLIRSSVDINVGSEQILHSYVFNTGIDYEWLPSLGLLRREEIRTGALRLPKQRWDII